jgi:HD-GYP domain-containing protein (c-di-GMP phosphodiesterase class II)
MRLTAEVRLALFALALAVLAGAIGAVLLAAGHGFGDPISVLGLSALALLAERKSIRLSSATEMSVSFLPFVFAAVVFGPLAAMVVGAFGLLTHFGKPHLRWVIWTSSRMIVGAAAGTAAATVGTTSSDAFAILLAGAAAAAITEVVLDLAVGGATVEVRGTSSMAAVVRTQGPVLLAAIPLYTPVIALLAYAYHHLSPWSVALFLIPAFASQRLFILYREQQWAACQLVRANERLESANTSFAAALVATLEARDSYTAGHSAAVAVYARDVAQRMGLSADEQRRAYLAGLVHDLGKIGLRPGLLEKPGQLKPSERREMERHSVIGERILENVEDYREIATIVRHHHERIDGTGYPDGLSADEIPLISRILAVADAYDAMTSDRPYRSAMPPHVARTRLSQAAGTQLDPAVVAAFEAVLAAARGNHFEWTVPDAGRSVEPAAAVALVAS